MNIQTNIEDTQARAYTGVFDIDRVRDKYALDDETIEFLKVNLLIDEKQQWDIRNCPQRTDEWLRHRQYRITASNFGAATNHSKYSTPLETVEQMLWKTFKGNPATEWGAKHEDDAERSYVRYQRQRYNSDENGFKVTHAGLIVPIQYPWAGISTDGFVFDDSNGRRPCPLHNEEEHMEDNDDTVKQTCPNCCRLSKYGGCEFKCPYAKRLYPFIPSQYYDQIQGAMGFLGLDWWDFVVWTPNETQIRRFLFNKQYWEAELFPKLEEFYFIEFLPRAIQKSKGLLQCESLQTSSQVDIGINLNMDFNFGQAQIINSKTTSSNTGKKEIQKTAVTSSSSSFSSVEPCGDFNFGIAQVTEKKTNNESSSHFQKTNHNQNNNNIVYNSKPSSSSVEFNFGSIGQVISKKK